MTTLLLVLSYALADRWAGGGWPWLDDKLPGRALFWGALVCAVAGFLMVGIPGAALAVIWGAHRSLGLDMWGGAADAQTLRQALGVLARYLLLVPAIALLGLWAGSEALWWGVAALAFALFATGLAMWYGSEVLKAVRRGEPIGDQNTAVELIRGAAYGFMCGGILS